MTDEVLYLTADVEALPVPPPPPFYLSFWLKVLLHRRWSRGTEWKKRRNPRLKRRERRGMMRGTISTGESGN